MNDKEIVTCSHCGREYVGKVPKGGDGSVLFPRKHRLSPGSAERYTSAFRSVKGYDWTCPGSYKLAKEYQEYSSDYLHGGQNDRSN